MLAVGVLATAGIMVGVSTANAGQVLPVRQTRTARIWFNAPAGIGYSGQVCEKAYLVGEDDRLENNPFDSQCSNNVTVGRKRSITIRLPNESVYRNIIIVVKGGLFDWDLDDPQLHPPTHYVTVPPGTGHFYECFSLRGQTWNARLDRGCPI
jgi:hypothetical protein